MPDIGRFFNPDPLSDQYSYQSHYNFSENRVVDGVELEGLEFVDFKIAMYEGQKAQVKALDNGATHAQARQVYRQTYNNNVPFGNIPDEAGVAVLRYVTPIEDVMGVITGRDLEGNAYHRGEAGVWAAASFIPLSKLGKIGKAAKVITRNDEVFVKFGDNVSDAFKEAYAGGKHSSMLQNVLKQDLSPAQIEKSIDTYMNGKRGIKTHLDKIANPQKYVKDWDNLRQGHRDNLMNGWKTEIQNNYEKIDILNDLLKR